MYVYGGENTEIGYKWLKSWVKTLKIICFSLYISSLLQQKKNTRTEKYRGHLTFGTHKRLITFGVWVDAGMEHFNSNKKSCPKIP